MKDKDTKKLFLEFGKKDEPAKDEPKKDEPAKDVPKKDEPAKDEPKKDEPTKDAPKKDEPTKDTPKKDGSSGEPHTFTCKYGTFHSMEEIIYFMDNFMDKKAEEWRKLSDKQSSDYTDLYEKYEESRDKNERLKQSEQNLMNTIKKRDDQIEKINDEHEKQIKKINGELNKAKTANAEGVFFEYLVADADEVAETGASEFASDIKKAIRQRNNACAEAQSEYDNAIIAFEAAKKKYEKKNKKAHSDCDNAIKAASDKFKGYFEEKYAEKRDGRAADAKASMEKRAKLKEKAEKLAYSREIERSLKEQNDADEAALEREKAE